MREIVSYCHNCSFSDWEKVWDQAEKKLRKESSRNALDLLLDKIGNVQWLTTAKELFQKSDLQAWLNHESWSMMVPYEK